MDSDRPGLPDAPTRLVLVRHGESLSTVNRVIAGRRTCVGLSDLGREQVERLVRRWSGHREVDADVLVSSDFRRAIETAEMLRPALGTAVSGIELDAGLGEHDPGPDVDGMTFAHYVELHGTPDWTDDVHAEIFPGGETHAQFHHRVRSAIDAVVERHEGRCVVIACHGGVIDATVRHLVGSAMTGGFELWARNTSITEFVRSAADCWRIVRVNDAAHLAGLPDSTQRVESTADAADPPAPGDDVDRARRTR